MASYYTPLLSLFLFCFASVYLLSYIEATKNNGGITIDLIHRDSPLSPFYNTSKTRFDRLKSAFERSISRKSSLKLISDSIRTASTSPKDIQAPLSYSGGEYLMKISLGTPPFEILGIADTGSDLTWTQCQPCTECYKQKAPLFDPRKTKTYRNISCESQACSAIDIPSCDTNNVCEYQYSYGDGSYTIGDLAVETFTFDSSTKKPVSFPKVVFGCGHKNGGLFSASESGIIGLGGGPLSIIRQLNKSIGGKFSYCLTLLNSNVSSKISFGTNAIVTGPSVVSTPLVKKYPDTYYYLTIEGISVGTNRVEYQNSKASVDEGNIIIDSGTTLTYLPSDLYDGLEAALVKAVKGKRVPYSKDSLKLCYELNSDFSAPPVIAHFKGADVELTQESTFLEVEQGVVCLTLVPSGKLGIFGNLHQMNYEIGYDIVGRSVNFLMKDCSKAH